MEFRILGPVEVTGADGPVRLGSRRERAVLAALVVGGGDVVSADQLIDALWGEAPPRSAAKTLQNYVLRLRKALGPAAIETQAPGYRLATRSAVIDAQRFDELIGSAVAAREEGRPDVAASLGREALALWRGTPLEELTGWTAADAEANRLRELHRVAAEETVDAELACGRTAPAVAQLEAMVAAEPLRERRWAMLMLALYRDGRQADALRAFQRARSMLGEELGIEPGRELRELERAIAAQDPSLDLPGEAEPHDIDAPPPYKGLAAYEADDHDLFFGRAEVVEALVRRAERSRFVALVGPSGSGKSSVVRAGVLATVGGRGAILTPGRHPLAELASTLAPLDGDGAPVVLVVDQFEEVFTQVDDPGERTTFIDALVATTRAATPRITVVVALRADFYGHCSAHPELAALLDAESTLLCPMASAEVRAAIEGPAASAGLRAEPGLVEVILRDVDGEPGGLPLLSHALFETWKRRTHRTLTVDGYQAAGGVRGAIAQTAESVHARLDPTQQRRAREVFLRLTELGDGTADTRRRVAIAELVDDPADDGLLQTLAAARLVTIDEGTVQIAHEALLREWPRLRSWLDEDREGRRLHRRLTRAATDWDAAGRDPTELHRGARLAAATEWADREDHRSGLNALERSFLQASVDHERAEADARERAHRRTRRLLASAALLLVVALVAGTVAVVQRGRADDQADRAVTASRNADIARLVAESAALRHEDPFVSALLAVEANDRRDDTETEGAVLASVLADPRRVRTLPTGTSDGVWPVPGTSRVLVLSRGRIGEWDTATGRKTATLPVTHAEIAAVRDDGLVAVGDVDGTIRFVDPQGQVVGAPIRSSLHGPVANAAFSPDGTRLAIAYGDWADIHPASASSRVHLYDVATRRTVPLAGSLAPVTALAFSPDGGRLALGTADRRIAFRDPRSGAPVGLEIPTRAPPLGLAFDPVRDRLAIGTTVTGVDVVSLTTGTSVGHITNAPAVDFPTYDDAGTRLAVSGDGPVRLYDAATLTPLPATRASGAAGVQPGDPMDAQTTPARTAFLPGGRLVVAGSTGPATVWDPDGITVLDRPVPGTATYVFPIVGRPLLAAPDFADSVRLIDARTGRPVGPELTPGPGAATTAALPATFAASYYHGEEIAVVNRSGVLQRFDVDHRTAIGPPIATGIVPIYAVYSRDMRQIAVGGRQGQVRLVDVRTRTVRVLPSPMTNYVLGLEFGPGDQLAASDWGHLVLYAHLTSAHPSVRDATRAVGGRAFGMDLSPDGRLLAVGNGGEVDFYDARTLRRSGPSVAANRDIINWLAFDRTGTRLVTGDLASTARLVDVTARRPIGPLLENSVAGSGSVFSQDGRTLGTWTFAGGASLSLDPAVWRRAACLLAGRNLTAAEWAHHLPGAGPRERTCPQFP